MASIQQRQLSERSVTAAAAPSTLPRGASESGTAVPIMEFMRQRTDSAPPTTPKTTPWGGATTRSPLSPAGPASLAEIQQAQQQQQQRRQQEQRSAHKKGGVSPTLSPAPAGAIPIACFLRDPPPASPPASPWQQASHGPSAVSLLDISAEQAADIERRKELRALRNACGGSGGGGGGGWGSSSSGSGGAGESGSPPAWGVLPEPAVTSLRQIQTEEGVQTEERALSTAPAAPAPAPPPLPPPQQQSRQREQGAQSRKKAQQRDGRDRPAAASKRPGSGRKPCVALPTSEQGSPSANPAEAPSCEGAHGGEGGGPRDRPRRHRQRQAAGRGQQAPEAEPQQEAQQPAQQQPTSKQQQRQRRPRRAARATAEKQHEKPRQSADPAAATSL
jgi:hypothetical protein